MLSFKAGNNGRPIAIIKGGKYKNKIIYVHDNEDNDDMEDMPYDYSELIQHPLFKKLPKRRRVREHARIGRMLKKNTKPRKKDILYNEVMKLKKRLFKKEIKLNGGRIKPFCNPYAPQHLYTAGPTGCGKSTSISEWAESYNKLNPKNNIYLFCRYDDDDDPAFKNLDLIKIMNDDSLILDPPNSSEFENSMVIFDDCSTIRDKEIREIIDELRQDLLETGRKKNIYVCVSNHLLADHTKTKENINECQVLIFFKASGLGAVEYALKKYYGFNTDTIKKINKLNSRWFLVCKLHPQYVLYDKGAFLI